MFKVQKFNIARELPRFENSRNVEMVNDSCRAEGVLLSRRDCRGTIRKALRLDLER
jgi:hypothetical protein